MDNPAVTPTPPDLAGLAWRCVALEDLPAIVGLAHACHTADGGLGFMFEADVLKSRYFPEAPSAAIGAFDPAGRLVASGAVQVGEGAAAARATIAGQVRPDQRTRGIGNNLMRWSRAQARSLLRGAAAGEAALVVATEALTDAADHLYRAHGFRPVMEALVMRRNLGRPLPERAFPPGVSVTGWQPGVMEQFYQAYYAAFRARPGFPGWSAAEWIGHVTENDHVPEWSLLALAAGVPAGFIIGNIDLTANPPGGYVWQIGVVPSQRRRGLASALMVEALRRMQAAGAPWADLEVHTNNPGAIEAYAAVGFTVTGRRARYEQTA
jgi:mycothiol synthase